MIEKMKHNESPHITEHLDLPAALPFIIDEIPLGLVVMDSERRVVLLNRAMEALTGFDRKTAKAIP
jgi:PAS domain-containing protein